jgi:hypothetical protein
MAFPSRANAHSNAPGSEARIAQTEQEIHPVFGESPLVAERRQILRIALHLELSDPAASRRTTRQESERSVRSAATGR